MDIAFLIISIVSLIILHSISSKLYTITTNQVKISEILKDINRKIKDKNIK